MDGKRRARGAMDACKYIALGGGSTKGIMYLGAIRAWHRYMERCIGKTFLQFCGQLEGFAGTSVGSVFALALMLDLSADQIDAVFRPHLSSPVRT